MPPSSHNSLDRKVTQLQRVLAAFFLATSILLLLFSQQEFLVFRNFLDGLSGDGSADPYTPVLHRNVCRILLQSSVASLLLASVCWFLPGRFAVQWTESWELRPRTYNSLRWYKVLIQGSVGWICGLTSLALVLRVPHLFDPIRYDEAHTYLTYARLPWFVGISLYHDPNNHVFHTLLIHMTTALLGNAEWMIRLPAFVAGVLLVPLTFLATRAVAGKEAGIAAGSLVAVSSALVEYATLSRGYSLVCCVTMFNVILAARIHRHPRGWDWGLLTLSSALGLWTVPIMVYPNILVWGWLFISGLDSTRRDRIRRRFLFKGCVGVAGCCVLTLILYCPIIVTTGFAKLRGQSEHVQAVSGGEYVSLLFHQFLTSRDLFLRDWSVPAQGLLGLSVLLSVVQIAVNSRWKLFAVLAPCVACVLLIVQQHVIPPQRVGLFLIPLCALFAGSGFAFLMRHQIGSVNKLGWGIGLILCVMLPIAQQFRTQSIRNSLETGACPAAESVLLTLREQDWFEEEGNPTPIIAVSPVSAPVVYYAERNGFSRLHFAPPTRDSIRQAVVLVNHLPGINKTSPAAELPRGFENQSLTDVLQQLDLEKLTSVDDYEYVLQVGTVSVFRMRR